MFKNLKTKFKFEKSKYPIKQISFWFLIVFSVFSVFNILNMYKYNFEVKNLNTVLKPVTLNLEFDRTLNVPSLFCFNDYCIEPQKDSFFNVYSYNFNKEDSEFYKEITKTIHFAFLGKNENFIKHINNITLYIGNDRYYFSKAEIQKFPLKELKIKLKNDNNEIETKSYSAYKIPVEKSNYTGIFNHICVLFLSLFYSSNLFIIPYFWLFFAFCIYYFNQSEFNFKLNFDKKKRYFVFALILLLGIILRLNHILYYPLWADEIYTKTVALESFKTCFFDPGNPPLFFLMEKLVSLVSNSDFALRFLPFVFGCSFVGAVYLLFSKMSSKFALFAAFLSAISTINIYHSQEARGYSLSMLLSVLLIYCLNRFLENKDKKNLLIYSLVVIFSVNNNYMLTILVFVNFLWGFLNLLIEKNKKIIEYTLANIICALTFLPYLFASSKVALNGTFNGWIEPLNRHNLIYIVNNYFVNKYIFIALFAILLLTMILNYILKKDYRKFYLQINSTLFLTLLIIALISIFVKPIMHKRTLLTLWGMLFIIETSSIYFIYNLKTKIKSFEIIKIFFCVLLVFLCFKINSPIPVRELYRLDDMAHFIENDINQYKDYEIHILATDKKDYFKQFLNLYNNKRIIWHFWDVNSGNYIKSIKKNDYIKSGKKAVLYTNAVGMEVQNVLFLNPRARYYKTNSAGNIKFIFD